MALYLTDPLFTASNGAPTSSDSLHSLCMRDSAGNIRNPYVTALRAVGEIIQDYDSDKQFPVLGFGARLPPDGIVSHEFFVNLDPTSPFCHGVQGECRVTDLCCQRYVNARTCIALMWAFLRLLAQVIHCCDIFKSTGGNNVLLLSSMILPPVDFGVCRCLTARSGYEKRQCLSIPNHQVLLLSCDCTALIIPCILSQAWWTRTSSVCRGSSCSGPPTSRR